MVKYILALSLVAATAQAVAVSEKKNLNDAEEKQQEHRAARYTHSSSSPPPTSYWPTYFPTYAPSDNGDGDKAVKFAQQVSETQSGWGAPPAPAWDDDGWNGWESSSSWAKASKAKASKGWSTAKAGKCSSSKGGKVSKAWSADWEEPAWEEELVWGSNRALEGSPLPEKNSRGQPAKSENWGSSPKSSSWGSSAEDSSWGSKGAKSSC